MEPREYLAATKNKVRAVFCSYFDAEMRDYTGGKRGAKEKQKSIPEHEKDASLQRVRLLFLAAPRESSTCTRFEPALRPMASLAKSGHCGPLREPITAAERST